MQQFAGTSATARTLVVGGCSAGKTTMVLALLRSMSPLPDVVIVMAPGSSAARYESALPPGCVASRYEELPNVAGILERQREATDAPNVVFVFDDCNLRELMRMPAMRELVAVGATRQCGFIATAPTMSACAFLAPDVAVVFPEPEAEYADASLRAAFVRLKTAEYEALAFENRRAGPKRMTVARADTLQAGADDVRVGWTWGGAEDVAPFRVRPQLTTSTDSSTSADSSTTPTHSTTSPSPSSTPSTTSDTVAAASEATAAPEDDDGDDAEGLTHVLLGLFGGLRDMVCGACAPRGARDLP
jgi:hypothetical protein